MMSVEKLSLRQGPHGLAGHSLTTMWAWNLICGTRNLHDTSAYCDQPKNDLYAGLWSSE